jgi:hypothetical protein
MTDHPTHEEAWEKIWAEYDELVCRSARAAADYERLSDMTRVIKARLMDESPESSIAGQERDAYASPEYEKHLLRVADARLEMEATRGELALHRDRLEVWRTKRADRRAEINLR